MTEEEAKTKWCPHVNIAAAHQHGFPAEVFTSRGDVGEEAPTTTNCLGSDCMAWRERGRLLGHNRGQHSDDGEWARFCKENPINGYCGLAGAA